MENTNCQLGLEKVPLDQFGVEKRPFDQLRLDKCNLNNMPGSNPFDNKHLNTTMKTNQGQASQK